MELQDGEVIPKGNTTYSEGDALPYNEAAPVAITEEIDDTAKRARYYNELLNAVKDTPEVAKFNLKPKADTDIVTDDELAGLGYQYADVYNKDKYEKGKLVGIPYKPLNAAGNNSPFASINYELGDQIENTLVENKNKETLTEYNTAVTELNDPSLTIANSIDEVDPKKLSYVQYKKQRQSIPELPDVASPEDITPEHMAKLQVAMAAKTYNSLFDQLKDDPEVIASGYKPKKYDDIVSPKEEDFLEEKLKNKLNKEYAEKSKSTGIKFTPVEKLWDFNSGITDPIDNAINKKNEDEWLANTNKLAKQYGIAPFKSVEDYDQTHVAKWDAYNEKQLKKKNSTIAELNSKLPEKERFPIVKTNEEYQFIFPKLKAAADKVQAEEVKKFEAKQVKEASKSVAEYNRTTGSRYTLPKTKGEAKLVLEKINKEISTYKSKKKAVEDWNANPTGNPYASLGLPRPVDAQYKPYEVLGARVSGNEIVYPAKKITPAEEKAARDAIKASISDLDKNPKGKLIIENLKQLDPSLVPTPPAANVKSKPFTAPAQTYTVTATDANRPYQEQPSYQVDRNLSYVLSEKYTKDLEEQGNLVNISIRDLEKKVNDYTLNYDNLKNKISKEGYTEENNKELDRLDALRDNLSKENNTVSALSTINKVYAGHVFDAKATRGSLTGAAWNNFVAGGEDILNGLYSLEKTIGLGFSNPLKPFGYNFVNKNIKGLFQGDEVVRNIDEQQKKDIIEFASQLKSASSIFKANVSDEYVQKKLEEGSIGSILMQLPRSVPAMALGMVPALQPVAAEIFALQILGEKIPAALNDPRNANLTINQLLATTLPNAMVQGYIENISMKAFGKSMAWVGLTKKAGSEIAAKELISAKLFSDFIQSGVNKVGLNKYISENFVKTAGILLEQTTIEGFENVLQDVTNNVNNSIVNNILKEKHFDVNNSVNAYWESLKSGMVGGFVFGAVSTAGHTIVNKIKVESINNKQFELVRQALQDPAVMKSWVTDIKLKIANKEITLDEGKAYLAGVKEFGYIASKIPTDISVENQKKSFDLIKERMAIEQEVKGKDENLTLAKKQRITEINKQLQAISLETVAAVDNGQVVTTNADGTVTTTPAKTIDGVGTYEFEDKLYVEDKDGNIKLEDGTSVTDQKTIDKIKNEGIFNEIAPTAAQKVETLRAAEQAELDEKIPNAEQYRVDGKVDRTKLTNNADRKAFDEVYAKYDKLITPLLEKTTPTDNTVFGNLPVGIKASEGAPTKKSHVPLFTAAKTALKVLNKLFPNTEIHFHENNSDFQKVLDATANGKKASKTDGNFSYIKDSNGKYTVRIDINLANPKASVTTVIHEAGHPILLSAFGENPNYFKYLKSQVAKSVGFTKNAKLKEFIKAYDDVEQPEEYLVQLGGILKEGEKIEPNVFRRIAEAINKIFLKITDGKFKPFENVKNSNDAVRYFASLVDAIRTGDLGNIKLSSQSQKSGAPEMGSKQSRGGLTATDMKSMTVADNGDLLFFHYGNIKGSKIDARKGTPKAYTTDKRVYTTNYYYTNENDRERMVGGDVNVIRVPVDRVYDFNKDVLGFFDEAKKNSEAQSKGQAFSPNRQADFIAQLAARNGFDMMVAKWGNGYRAESPKALTIDVALTKQMRTNGSLSTAAVDEKLNQDIYNAAASKANGNSEKYRSAFYGIKDITAKDIMEHPILSRGIPKKLVDKYNGGQIKSKQSRSSEDNAKNLDEYRRNIDSIDNKILSNISNPLAVENLVYDRNKQVLEIVNYKKENGIPIEDTSREKIIIEKVMKRASEMGVNVNDAVDLFKKIIEVSKELQRDFLGIDSDNRASNTQGFFSDVVTGDKKYTPISSYKNIIPLTESELKFEKNYKKFLGFFDEHIATSIPTFRETQIKVGSAIVSMFSKKLNIRNSELGKIAEKYKKDNGIDSTFSVESTNVNPYFFKKLAEFHKNEKDDRSNKAMAKSYRAFLDETKKQYQYLIDAGYKIEPWMKQGEPYGTSSSLVRKDVDDNKHLYYLRSRAATGSGNENESAENYMPFENSGITINGEDVLFNDLFRAVHDIFGHVLVNNSFSTQGEFNAYQTHSKMYSKEAQKALFLETVMYNAWYDANKNYAPRKIYDIPEEFISYANANPLVYDIGGSEGGFIKAISSVSNGNINTINLEPNAEMVSSFNNKPIEGSSIIPEAFYEGFDEYKKHTPNKKADIVHESMVFQFIDSKRNNYIQEVKDNYLKEGGLFLTEEKLIPINDKEWADNEKNKDDNHKSLYYKADQITKKQEQVLTGMLKNQTYYSNYKSLLEYNFKHVAEYWDAGNFRGFAASDSKSILDEFIKGVGGKIVSDFSSAEGQQIKSKQSLKAGDKVKIEGVSVTIPSEAQQDLLKQKRTAKSYFDEKVRLMEPSPLSKEEIKSILNRDDIAILTGTNPDGNAVADNTNNLLNKKAEDWLKRNGYTYHQVTGKYGQTESSFLVEGITGNVALEFAKIFKQDSVLQSEGLIYREGTIEKRIADGDVFGVDVAEPEADYVSAIKTNTSEVVGFQIGVDLGNKVQYKVKSKQSKVSDILNSTFDSEAKKVKADKLDIKALAKKVVGIVQSSKLYEQSDDVQRDIDIVDFLKSKGINQKRVIEPRNKNIISVNEVTALKDQIRLEIKAANDGAKSIEDAVKKIGEIIKSLAKGKKISVTSAKSLINKFSNMDTANKDSVKKVLDYAEKIFNDAEYADKLAQARALNAGMKRAASNNAIPPDTRSIALSFAKINPEAVSDIDAHLEAAKKIKDALVGIKENGVKIRKAIDINEMLDYLNTAMVEQETYDANNPTTTRIVEPLDEEKALEYLASEHDSLLQVAKAIAPSAVLTDVEMAQLKNFLKLSIDDFETMADKIAAVEALDNFVKNSDMGKIPFILNTQQVNANINKGVKAIMPKLTSVSLMWFSEQKAKIRGWFDNKTWYRDSPKDFSKTLAYFMNQSIRRIDNLIGNFKNNDVFNNTFKALASGYAKYLFKINSMDADIIFQKVLSSFNGNMYKAVQHCYKMTMYKLQLEYESNIGNREVIPAMMHLEKTLEDGNLTKKDKAELRKLIKEFSITDATTGEVKIDTDKIWNSFSKVEKNAAEMLASYYEKLTPYAKHVAVSLRGVPFNPRANYMMLNVINQQTSLSATPPSASQVFAKGTTKAGTIIERDGTAHAVSLDPYNTFNAANRDVMMDYCLLNPIKTVEAIFDKLVEDTANDEKANDVAKSLQFVFKEITDSIINRSFVMSDKVWTDVFNFIKKVGARYILAKIDKAPAEFAGNAIFAGIAYTENILEGIKNNAYQRNFELSQAMEALDSYSIDRLYPHKGQSGAFLDPNSFDIDVRDKKHFIDGVSNVAQVVYYNSLLQAQKGGEAVSDFLVTAPDLAVGRMAWEGTLRLEFKKETGTEIDLEKIIKKDYDYLEKYKDALEKATTEADRVVVDIASSKNPFVGMAKESVRRDYHSFMTSIDGFLRSFSKNENQVGMDAAYALVKSGKIDRARGVRLLAAILARGGVYNSVRAKVLLLLTGLGFAIVNGITGGDDSEEKRRRRAKMQLDYMNIEGDDWAEKSPVTAGKKIISAGNIYEVVTGGVTSTNPPSDTSGKIITDGTAKYKWIGAIPRIQGSITGIKDNVSMGTSLRTYDKEFIEKATKAAAPEETMSHSFKKGAAQSAVGIILGRNSGAIFSNLFMAQAVEYANEKFIHPAISSDPYNKYRDGIMYSKMIDRTRKDPELNFIIDNTGVFNPFFKAAVTGYRMFDNKYGDRLREVNKKIENHEKGVKVPREESSQSKYYELLNERDALLEKQKPVKVMMAKNIIIAALTVTGVLPSGKTIDAIADKTLQDKILSPSDMDNIIKNIENARNYSGGEPVRLENPKDNDKVLDYPEVYTNYILQGRKIPAKKP